MSERSTTVSAVFSVSAGRCAVLVCKNGTVGFDGSMKTPFSTWTHAQKNQIARTGFDFAPVGLYLRKAWMPRVRSPPPEKNFLVVQLASRSPPPPAKNFLVVQLASRSPPPSCEKLPSCTTQRRRWNRCPTPPVCPPDATVPHSVSGNGTVATSPTRAGRPASRGRRSTSPRRCGR